MNRRKRITAWATVVTFLLTAALGGAARRNGPERGSRGTGAATTPSANRR